MGKLVLGIIGVTLLQIAFFVRTATDEQARMVADPINPPAVQKVPELSRVEKAPDVVIPAERVKPEASEPTRKTFKRTPESDLRPPVARFVDKAPNRYAPVRARVRIPSEVTYTEPKRSSDTLRARPAESRVTIPKGYTMALVDYPVTPTNAKVKQASIPRKRSLIARAFPALVKKPWRWMKSLASKLN